MIKLSTSRAKLGAAYRIQSHSDFFSSLLFFFFALVAFCCHFISRFFSLLNKKRAAAGPELKEPKACMRIPLVLSVSCISLTRIVMPWGGCVGHLLYCSVSVQI